jgi:hypothetical protein
MIRILSTLLLVLLLQGCAFLDYFKNPPSIPPGIPVNISTEALKECPLLKNDVTVASFEDAIIAYGDVAAAYGTCANKQKASIRLIKELGNIK